MKTKGKEHFILIFGHETKILLLYHLKVKTKSEWECWPSETQIETETESASDQKCKHN